jgi:hypothetical protein
MTTGPDGQDVAVRDRLAGVEQWYGPDHLVTKFWARAKPILFEAVQLAITMEIYTVVSSAATRDALKRLGQALDR